MSDTDTTKLKVKYETMSAQYASQCILNSTKEEILLDFSSGVVPDPATGQPVVPVHTRIAMTMGGALRLRNLLDKALNNAMTQAQAQAQAHLQATTPGPRPKITSPSGSPSVAKKKTPEK